MNQDPEYLCLDCGYTNTPEEFGPELICPTCLSSDVLNYRLWKERKAKTPPPRLRAEVTT